MDTFKALVQPIDKLQRIRLYAASFAIDWAWTGFTFAIAWHAEKTYHVGYEVLGYLGAAASGVYVPLTLVAGRLSDKIAPEKIFRSALVSFLVCLCFLVFNNTISGLFIAASWTASSFAFFWPPLQKKLSTFTSEQNLGPVLGMFNISWCAGVFVGPIISSWAYAKFGLPGSLAASGFVILIALILLMPKFSEAIVQPESKPKRVQNGNRRNPMLFLSLARIAVFAGYFVVAGITRLFPRFATHFGIDVVTAGSLISVIFATQTATFLILKFTSIWHYSFRTLVGLQLIAGIGLLLIPITRNITMIGIILCSTGALSGLIYYSSLFYALALREKSGRRSGIHEAVVGSGAALGPLLCGWVGSFTGQPWSPFVFGACILLVAITAEIIFFFRTTKLDSASPSSHN